ncbi:MAG: hypothetical protein IPG72_08985 [Ardenticatenales bacterium]|nr:hypothetical protein [Ardenticatenales bacterium]
MLDRFLSTKLYLPRPRHGLVARPRLAARLDETPPGGVAVLSAPAGSGKTVLGIQWLNALRASTEPSTVAWIALDGADNDAARFWAGVVAALHAAAPSLAPGAEALVRSRDRVEQDALLTALINGLAAHPTAIVVALDHLNAIDDPVLLDSLGYLLEHLPENVRAILTTRVEPPLPTTRWLVEGRLCALTEADLRFNEEEAHALLAEVTGLGVDADQVARLTERTEGWVGGLVLAARAARDRGVETILSSFDGSHRYVGDYLATEVLNVQPNEVRAFLLRTSVLDRLCGSLCDAVVGAVEGTAQTMIEHLDAENVFVVPLDDHRQWYRYHRLFADALRVRLTSEHTPLEVSELHQRAAAWYGANGYIVRAVRHSLEAGDEDDAAALILLAADDAWTQGRAATLSGWIGGLPAGATDRHPRLGVYAALSSVLLGQSLETVDPLLDQLMDALADDAPPWRGRLAVVRATAAGVRGQSAAAAAEARSAMQLLDADDLPWRGLATIDLGLAELAHGHEAAAAAAFAEARAISIRAANGYATLAASVNLARAHHADGALHAAAAAYREALACAEEHNLQQLPLTGLAHIGLGDVLREWDQRDEAAQRITDGLVLAEGRHVHVRTAVSGHLARARLAVATGRWADVASDFDAAEALSLRHDRPEYLAEVEYARAIAGLQAGDPGPALRWAGEGGPASDGTISEGAPEAVSGGLLLRAQLALFLSDLDTAAHMLETLSTQLAGSSGRTALRVGRSFAAARLALAHGHRTGAALSMRTALQHALPEHYVRLFLDEGDRAVEALELARSTADGIDPLDEALAGYVAELLAAASHETALRAVAERGDGDSGLRSVDGAKQANARLLEPLSPRELEVLAAVAAGETNHEIAERLTIALSTVKTHVNNIYGKLGARNRTQAVAVARELGLL